MERILIIDDDEAIGNLEQEVLERAGYHVLRAYSGTEALLLLNANCPDLILLDLMLPGLSGDTPDCTDNSLKTHVSNLRKKLREISGKDYIEAVWGIGFRLNLDS